MRRSHYRDRNVVWAATAATVVASLVLGWFDLMWPYLAAVVAAIVAFQLWWFRESLRGKWNGARSR